MPAGTQVGARHSLMTLGTFNNACHFTVGVDFIFYNVALPNNTADPRASTNIAWPLASGDNDRFGGWVVGSGKRVSTKLAADIDDSQTAITVEDGTGIPNGH
jgi:hypothetical protein